MKSRIATLVHNSIKRRDTHIKITSRKGYFIDTINPGRDSLYTPDQICSVIDFLIDNICVKFEGCSFVKSLGFHWKIVAPPC